MHNFKNWPFEYSASAAYLSANTILMVNGALTDDAQTFPTFDLLSNLDSSAWQSLSGFLLIVSAIIINFIRHYPDGATKINAFVVFIANICLLISGAKQEAFFVHSIAFIPVFMAVGLMLQGNKVNDKSNVYNRYPVACGAFLFFLGAPPILYNAIISQDWVLSFVVALWVTGHFFFALSDRNFQKKLFS